jgi:hypothetical protein
MTPYDKPKNVIAKVIRSFNRILRRRASVEAVISHLKNDHRLSRNYLKGILGDQINPLLAATAFNLLKFVKLSYEQNLTPPRTIKIKPSPARKRFHWSPLWKREGTLFGTQFEVQFDKPEPTLKSSS